MLLQVPWYKGSIERLIKTIHDGLIHKQPGTTFSNIFDKGDYDSAKHAVICLDLLNEIIHKWIVDIYSQEIHTGINDIPARRWKNSVVKFPPALPPAHTDLDIIFGKVAYRTISGTVIHFLNLEYSDSVLLDLKRNLKKDEKIKIKYNPTDLGIIYVYDAFWTRYVPIAAVDQEYAKGLTEWQHEVIRKFIRRSNQCRINRHALLEAKEYIRQKIAEELGKRPKKLKHASRIAKWMAFEDPTDARFISHSRNNNDLTKNGNSTTTSSITLNESKPKSLKNGLKNRNMFSISSNVESTPLEFSEDQAWETLYAEFGDD